MNQRPMLVAMPALPLGVAFAFAFPPWNFVLLGVAALCGLALCIKQAPSNKAAFWTGYAFGAGQFLVNFFWIANAFAVREGFSYAQGLVAVVALALAVALYPGFIALAAYRLSKSARGPWAFAFAFGLFWLLGEWLRGVLFTGFPWNPVGAMWGSVLPMAQFASVAGVYGLGAVTVLSAALLAGVLEPQSIKKRALSGAAGMSVFCAVFVYGSYTIPDGELPVMDDVKLVLVQANIAQGDKWDSTLLTSHVERHIALSQQGMGQAPKSIIIWPETAYPYLIESDVRTQYDLQRMLGSQATLIFGANRFVERGGARSARNTLFVLQGGTIKAGYDKVHLVPFGEYVPLGPLLSRLGVGKLVEALSSFSKGPGAQVLEVAGVPAFAPMICYEGIFPGHLSGLERRPEWILNISNDAWFGQSSGPPQHLNLVRFRAIEQGLSLVRSTGTGITAVIDAHGRIKSQLRPDIDDVLVSNLPKGRMSATLFARYGGLNYAILVMVFAAGFWLFPRD